MPSPPRSPNSPALSAWFHRLAPAAAAGVVLVLTATQVFAAGDAAAGQRLTQQWCSGCHIASRNGPGTDAAPPLADIAQHQGRSEAWLRGWLAAPHPPMPNLSLSRQEIDNIVAYLESLKQR